MDAEIQTKQAQNLVFFGLVLFLLGLLIGLFVPIAVNPRMALSAHLEGIMNGIFLMVLGLIWKQIVLSGFLLKLTYGLVFYGTFANLTAVVIAAMTGFGKMMPIAGGKEGAGFLEALISFLLVTLALCMIAVCILVLIGYYKRIKHS